MRASALVASKMVALLVAGIWLLAPLSPGAALQQRSKARLLMSSQAALDEGKALLKSEKYREAWRHFVQAYEADPNSVTGREGLLLAADALYLLGGYLEAQTAYRDYLNRYITSAEAAYAQFQLANCLAKRIERPNREQDITREALREYENLIQLYPTSDYAARAAERIVEVKNNLAEHEFVVGKFYLRTGRAQSAVHRFRDVLEDYPDYHNTDRLLFFLARAYEADEQPENAAQARQRLLTEFPESRYARRLE